MRLTTVKGLCVGDIVKVIKGRGILGKIVGGSDYTVRDIDASSNKIMVKGYWIDVTRFELVKSTGGLLNIAIPTPVGAQGFQDSKPVCSCDIIQLLSGGCCCGAVSNHQKQYNKNLDDGKHLVS